MTTLVRGLLAAPVATLVAWAAGHGVPVDAELVGTVLAAVATAVVAGVLHWAEARWPVLGRAVGWLARQRSAVAGPPTSSPHT